MKIIISIKDNLFPMTIEHVEEHYCTEKMFFCSREDGSAVYINLNDISKIYVVKEEDEDDEEDGE